MDNNANFDQIITEIYPLIKAEHPCWSVIIYAIVLTILTTFGILLNFSVIFVTIRTKKFRGSVNILLAFYSLCEIANLSGNFLSIYSAFSGHYFMTFKNGIYFVIISFISSFCALNLMLFIGIERLFVVLFPLKKLNKKLFLSFALCSVLFLTIVNIVISSLCFDVKFYSYEFFGNYYEIGRIFFCSEKCVKNYVQVISSVIVISSIIVYALIAIVIHFRKVPSNANSAEFNNQIFRSLFSIVSINFGGYILSFLFILIINPNDTMVKWHMGQIFGILMHISASSNAPILFWRSLEYREAYGKAFAFLLHIFCKCSAVVTP